jgi:hypothetical protein
MRAAVIGGIRYAKDFAVIWRGLDAIPIEFDLMYPAVAGWHLLD